MRVECALTKRVVVFSGFIRDKTVMQLLLLRTTMIKEDHVQFWFSLCGLLTHLWHFTCSFLWLLEQFLVLPDQIPFFKKKREKIYKCWRNMMLLSLLRSSRFSWFEFSPKIDAPPKSNLYCSIILKQLKSQFAWTLSVFIVEKQSYTDVKKLILIWMKLEDSYHP